MFLQVSVCPQGGVRGGGGGGGGMCGGRHMWQGACVAGSVCGRGASVAEGGMCATQSPCQILRDTVNERAVRILLECILVWQ